MRAGRPVDLRCVHGFATEGGGGIFDQRDVIAEFHPETSGGLDASVGHHAHQDDLPDAVLLELEVEVRVGEAALSPMLVNDDITFLGTEFRVEFPAPSAAFENTLYPRGHYCSRANWKGCGPCLSREKTVAASSYGEHRNEPLRRTTQFEPDGSSQKWLDFNEKKPIAENNDGLVRETSRGRKPIASRYHSRNLKIQITHATDGGLRAWN
jgi:hypothetical protein